MGKRSKRKPHNFDVVSRKVKCIICGKPIKLNVVERKTTKAPALCYNHYLEQKVIRQKLKEEKRLKQLNR